jgi:hypothetical protein
MTPIKAYPLFPYYVFKGTIDPTKYNKQAIIDTLESNYKKDPNRNNWDKESNMHHSYKDWENPEFKRIPETPGLPELYQDFFENSFKQFSFSMSSNFKFFIANITGTKEGQFMKKHHHNPAFYSAIHYVQLAPEHSRTVFVNPASNEQNLTDYTMDLVRPKLHRQDLVNSSFFQTWCLDVEENDILCFPSFLEHFIPDNPPTDTIRITLALNVFLDGMPISQ